MSSGARRAGLALFGVAAVAILVWNLTPAPPRTGASAAPFGSPVSPQSGAGASSVPPAEQIDPPTAQTRDYALALNELRGFPPDLAPGATVELWVGWDRPSGAAPKLQRLIRNAVFVRTIPPVTPGGPTTVVLRVPIRRMPDLLWADGFGTLSVAVPS